MKLIHWAAALTAALAVSSFVPANASTPTVTALYPPHFTTSVGGEGTFTTDAQAVSDTFLLYIELDPATASTITVQEAGVYWASLETVVNQGKLYQLWWGSAQEAGTNRVSVYTGNSSITTIEMGWQQFAPGAVVGAVGSVVWSGSSVKFPNLGTGYLWEYGKSTSVATCLGPRCTQTPQQNVLISGKYTGQPVEATQPGSRGFSLGVQLLPRIQ